MINHHNLLILSHLLAARVRTVNARALSVLRRLRQSGAIGQLKHGSWAIITQDSSHPEKSSSAKGG